MASTTTFLHYVGAELNNRCPTATNPSYRGPIRDEDRALVRLAVVAEKGARDEVREGRPLIGTTGQYTRRHITRTGVPLSHVYLTNTVHRFNDPDANPTTEDVIREQVRLYRELGALPNLRCIIALGAAAMASLSNFHLDGILKRRGSRLPTCLGVPMVPTPHPSFYVNGEWRYRSVVQFDFNRAARDAYAPSGLRLPSRDYYIEPTFSEALDWLSYLDAAIDAVVLPHGPLCEFDIEAVRGPRGRWYLSQIAFSNNPKRAFCIPLMHVSRTPWWTPNEEFIIRRRIAALLSHEDWCYGTQNGLSDCYTLRLEGFLTPHMSRGFDTMYAHKLLAPDLPHDLAFIDSIYTDEQYYKDESGFHDKTLKVSDRQFQIYNCKDAATQAQSAVGIHRDLEELDMLRFYYDHVQSQWSVIHDDLMIGGMRIDKDELGTINERLEKEVNDVEATLTRLVGWTPNTRSPIDMERIYNQYKIPIERTKTGKAKRGEEVLLNYANRYVHFAPIVHTMLEITRRKTLQSNFLDMALDERGFYHPTWQLFGTTTFRLACKGSAEGGPQVLNTPYSLRHVFIADNPERDELTKADLKQAEKMIVVYDSADMALLPAFEQGLDVHRIVGTWIYLGWDPRNGIPPKDLISQIEKHCPKCLIEGNDECTHSRRFVSKQCNHAFDYKMGVRKFIYEVLPPSGIFMSEGEAKRIRAKIVTPALAGWQKAVEDRVASGTMWFTNLFGMKREFYGIPGDDLYREILAWLASSPVSCITAQAMRRVHQWTRGERNIRIIHQGYDALLVSHPRSKKSFVRSLLERAFHHELNAHGRRFVIPLDITTGDNWAMKAPPARPNTMIASA